MKIIIVSIFLSILSNVIACSSDTGCFIADSVSQVRIVKVNNEDYFIYQRISGLQEKEVFYELYIKEPTFDACGKSTILAKSDVHVDSTKGIALKLVVDKMKLSIVYTKDNYQGADLIIEVK